MSGDAVKRDLHAEDYAPSWTEIILVLLCLLTFAAAIGASEAFPRPVTDEECGGGP